MPSQGRTDRRGAYFRSKSARIAAPFLGSCKQSRDLACYGESGEAAISAAPAGDGFKPGRER